MARPKATNPHSAAVRVRLQASEKQALTTLSEELGQPPSRVIRRLIREAVTGGPDLFDDGVAAITEAHRQLSMTGNALSELIRCIKDGRAAELSSAEASVQQALQEVETLRKCYGAAVERAQTRSVSLARKEGPADET